MSLNATATVLDVGTQSPSTGRTSSGSLSSAHSTPTTIKHQPYLDGGTRHNEAVLQNVFSDSSSILGYSDGIVVASGHHIERDSRSYTSSPGSFSGGESCSHESSQTNATASSSSRRLKNETASQREERLRKNAERGKLRRQEESQEQRMRRLARNAERGKLRRMEESNDKRAERLKKNAERQKMRRILESPEERQLRLWKNAERQRIRRNAVNSGSGLGIKLEYAEYTEHEHLL